MEEKAFTPATPGVFNYFRNHGDEDGNNSYTVIYGDPDSDDHVIITTCDTANDAQESCFRLDSIIGSIACAPEIVAENLKLREALRQAESEAIAILKWAAIRGWNPVGEDAYMLVYGPADDERERTSSELYELFKKEKLGI
jgi:hypothetical protein